jgi:two-component system chemotaxis response regulator CheV
MITAIDLRNCLQRGQSQPGGLFIITSFNKLDIAFHVDSVIGIHRVSWVDIIKPGATVTTAEDGISTGIIKINGKLIIILDFEKIISDINPETGLKVTEIDALGTREGTNMPILIAEDSSLLRKLIVDSLRKSGYDNVIKTENGEEAWEYICKYRDEGTLDQNVRLLITDIEMPLMDGHRLTKLVKSDEETKHIPVVIFSSLVNDEMKKKGDELGADAQLSKPEIGNLVKVIDQLLNK